LLSPLLCPPRRTEVSQLVGAHRDKLCGCDVAMRLLATDSAWVLFCICAAAVVWLVCVLPPFGWFRCLLSPPNTRQVLPPRVRTQGGVTHLSFCSCLLRDGTCCALRQTHCTSQAEMHEGWVALAVCAHTGRRGYVALTLPRDAQATATVAEGVAAFIVLVVLLHHGTTNNDSITVHWVVCCALPTCGCVSCRAQ
jgi:hypothetical protein